jgi:iron complex outermembrane receptor protein
MKPNHRTGLLSFAVASVVAITSGPIWAQESTDEEFLEEIVTTGTRREGQSPTETLSPIDVLSGDAFVNQSTFDVTEALTKIAPSLNTQRFPIADGTAVIRPVSLRNMSPDQTLVLVDTARWCVGAVRFRCYCRRRKRHSQGCPRRRQPVGADRRILRG